MFLQQGLPHTGAERQKPAKYETQKIREIDYWLYMPATV